MDEISWKRLSKPKTCNHFKNKKKEEEKIKNYRLLCFHLTFIECSFLRNLTAIFAKSLRTLYCFYASNAWGYASTPRVFPLPVTVHFLLFLICTGFQTAQLFHSLLAIASLFDRTLLSLSLSVSPPICITLLGVRSNHELVR